jgi:hypothetical protein
MRAGRVRPGSADRGCCHNERLQRKNIPAKIGALQIARAFVVRGLPPPMPSIDGTRRHTVNVRFH